jgi:hypothetical protein
MAVLAAHCASFHEAVDQFDRAVVADTKLLGKRSDGGTSALRQCLHCKQDLVLVRFDSFGSGCFFAEVQKLPDGVTELGELPEAKF